MPHAPARGAGSRYLQTPVTPELMSRVQGGSPHPDMPDGGFLFTDAILPADVPPVRLKGCAATSKPFYRPFSKLPASQPAASEEAPSPPAGASGKPNEQAAEPLFQQALAICEQALPLDHPDTAIILKNYAYLLREMNRPGEAQRLEQRAKAMRARLSSKTNI